MITFAITVAITVAIVAANPIWAMMKEKIAMKGYRGDANLCGGHSEDVLVFQRRTVGQSASYRLTVSPSHRLTVSPSHFLMIEEAFPDRT